MSYSSNDLLDREEEVKNDLISREALKKALHDRYAHWGELSKYKISMSSMFQTLNNLIDNAPTVEAYSEEDMCNTTSNGYDIGYEFAKRHYEFDTEDFKKFIISKIDMQDLYLPIHFFGLLDEYCGAKMKGGAE